jgi:hypothetical protein
MKVLALYLGILGSIAALGLWTMNAMLICCAFPPGTVLPTPVVDLTPLMQSGVGDILYLGTPLVALVAAVAAIMAVVPRFQGETTFRIVIVCGLLLALGLSFVHIAKVRPTDAADLFLILLFTMAPGGLVIVSGMLTRNTLKLR